MPHWKARDEVEIREIARRLFRISATTSLIKGVPNQIHSYFLVGVRGNVLFHGPDRVPFYKEQADFFESHGGIGLQVLTHEGDASKACAYVEKTWGAPVYVNEWDLTGARRKSGLPIPEGFKNGASLVPRVRGIHLPGHTVGFTGYRFAIDGVSYLIAGHAIRQLPGGGWGMAVHPLMVDAALGSLRTLRELDVDFLLPDVTRREPPPPLAFGRRERAEVTERVLEYLAKKHELPSG